VSAWDLNPSGPAISIVIPAYNCERFIAQTVGSIQAQTLQSWECVIVDDGSKDGTLGLIREAAADPRIQVATQPNSGPAAARNRGVEMIDSRSQYAIFMDSDDLWMPDALEVLKTEVEQHPEAIGAHALGQCIDQDGAPKDDPAYEGNGNGRYVCDSFGRLVPLEPSAPTTFESLWYSNPYPPGLILSRRSAYEKAGFFDSAVCPMEDWDMMIRLSRYGDFRFVNKVLLSYRRHDHNLSAQPAWKTGLHIRGLLYKTYFSDENDPVQGRIVRNNWRATELLHLRQKGREAREHLAKADLMRSASALAASCVHLCRYARGYPTLRRQREAAAQ
jgi:glycosyltransferase involved in cell wall biosynthesis